jgi:hypothetical protein
VVDDGWSFDFELTGRGWAQGTIRAGESRATATASYLRDALADLLGAARLMLADVREARCSWWEEPGEFRWVFLRPGSDVRVRVIRFDDLRISQSDDAGTVLFDETGAPEVVAAAIEEGARRALERYGEDRYREQWAHDPFPTESLDVLAERLREIRTK